MDVAPLDFAATLRAEAARRRISQGEIGAAIGLNQRAVSRRFRGEVEFSISEVDAIARLLEMSVDQLLALARRDSQAATA